MTIDYKKLKIVARYYSAWQQFESVAFERAQEVSASHWDKLTPRINGIRKHITDTLFAFDRQYIELAAVVTQDSRFAKTNAVVRNTLSTYL